jgi:hypothetical protein
MVLPIKLAMDISLSTIRTAFLPDEKLKSKPLLLIKRKLNYVFMPANNVEQL